MWENFDSKIAHSHLSVKVLKLSLHHDIEGFEEERVEVGLDLLFALVFPELLEFLSFHTHEGGAMFSGEVNVNGFSEVRDFSCDHVGREVRQELLATMLAAEACRVLDYLPPAIIRHARWVKDAIIVLDARHIPIQEEKVVLISVILITKTLIDLTNEVQVAVSSWFVSVVMTRASTVMVQRTTAEAAIATLVCLMSQTSHIRVRIVSTALNEVIIPDFQRTNPLMVHVNEEN